MMHFRHACRVMQILNRLESQWLLDFMKEQLMTDHAAFHAEAAMKPEQGFAACNTSTPAMTCTP